MVLQKHPNYRVIVVDALTYAGNLSTIADMQYNPETADRFRFYPSKIQDDTVINGIIKAEKIDYIINFAAESHNDRSILEPGSFIQTDVYGVFTLLDATRHNKVDRMLHVSTDEVYGTIDDGQFTEQSPIEPNTPYSASKAGGEMQVRAHRITYDTPALVTRCGNNFGPFQYPEKLIPFFVTRLIDDKKVPLYGTGAQVRDWVYVMDHCSGIDHVLHYGTLGEAYKRRFGRRMYQHGDHAAPAGTARQVRLAHQVHWRPTRRRARQALQHQLRQTEIPGLEIRLRFPNRS